MMNWPTFGRHHHAAGGDAQQHGRHHRQHAEPQQAAAQARRRCGARPETGGPAGEQRAQRDRHVGHAQGDGGEDGREREHVGGPPAAPGGAGCAGEEAQEQPAGWRVGQPEPGERLAQRVEHQQAGQQGRQGETGGVGAYRAVQREQAECEQAGLESDQRGRGSARGDEPAANVAVDPGPVERHPAAQSRRKVCGGVALVEAGHVVEPDQDQRRHRQPEGERDRGMCEPPDAWDHRTEAGRRSGVSGASAQGSELPVPPWPPPPAWPFMSVPAPPRPPPSRLAGL